MSIREHIVITERFESVEKQISALIEQVQHLEKRIHNLTTKAAPATKGDKN